MESTIKEILAFWFGELDQHGLCDPRQHDLWFRKSDDTDQLCKTRFGDKVISAVAGEFEAWAETDSGLIALILLLDQITRNIGRDTPAAFAGDSRALTLATAAIDNGRHETLPAIHRTFLYLPLEHSEAIDDQDRCVALMQALAHEVDSPQFLGFADYAEQHQRVIAQFGRFPHRNVILGRQSTAAELAYLKEHGGF